MRTYLIKMLGLLCILVGISCTADDAEPYYALDENLEVVIPENFPAINYDLSANPPTKNGVELGKKLFYDGNLSANGFISCGFCHEQRFAFTHHGHQFSHGIDDLEGTRNAPAIQNMAFQTEFAWDGATSHLDLFPIIPITNEVEMGETMTNVLSKLQADSEYQRLFASAFEDAEVSNENFLKALAQFMVMMISSNSKYDKYVRNEEGGDFSAVEKEGLAIFEAKCASCHATDLFTDNSFRNNGLPPYAGIDDVGRAEVSGSLADNYKFKVPSLRNVAITAPYMHDGRFGSLQSVLNFYTSGVQESETLDPILKQNDRLGIVLTTDEQEALIAFLNTLTDNEFLEDARFAEY
ncbi:MULTISPECIES: cytochrome-c peroxidase [Leeuwenhoekiella]|jgi:cytochrome c peroxidase|uniref:cytochrome-c peroxidase n=1 Tax=Leeuwenhoekiella TaxID=283735 RepID=UPI000C44E389|nr:MULTISPECIES: cytochrome c peroxidase [Leeuwenhoekiella]MAO43443.1 cytochrome-c peroxidase [Leeuwenhoekiella sp.]MBQ51574.1 cytochrome-c peroxidase [Leeuwenhoekiella sp.]HBT09323.1 cytochrome-c peroxidase [Leeuwenhoekiella sp.]HCW64618.1 cytochrome-c peroxidase [Leeuwenhoekiella sp.]|tara:strand:- start:2141 stop:3196 length:1056 start_codon:yes stop_codon:yes gene_type:complete